MSGSGREALSEVREWSGGPLGGPGVVGRLSRMLGVVGRPYRMSESGREALSDVQEALPDFQGWLKCPPGCLRVFDRPSRTSGSCREALPDVREWSEDLPDVLEALPGVREALPDIQEWFGGSPGCPKVFGRSSQMSGIC